MSGNGVGVPLPGKIQIFFVPTEVEKPVGPGKQVVELPRVEKEVPKKKDNAWVATEDIERTRNSGEVIRQGVVAECSAEPLF